MCAPTAGTTAATEAPTTSDAPTTNGACADLPVGIQLSLSDSALGGWTKFYDETYTHSTYTSNIEVPNTAQYMFVGARHPDGTIALGAFGEREAVLAASDVDTAHEHNGAWWYSRAGRSFGFAPTSTILQTSTDVIDSHDPTDSQRLSWILDDGPGKNRAGNTIIDSYDAAYATVDTLWRKQVYCTWTCDMLCAIE